MRVQHYLLLLITAVIKNALVVMISSKPPFSSLDVLAALPYGRSSKNSSEKRDKEIKCSLSKYPNPAPDQAWDVFLAPWCWSPHELWDENSLHTHGHPLKVT